MFSIVQENTFEWNEYQQNTILGAFSVTHVIMQIPGGVLAQRYGAKAVFGLCNGLSALLSVVIPASAKINYETLVAVRLLQGLISVKTHFRHFSRTMNFTMLFN